MSVNHHLHLGLTELWSPISAHQQKFGHTGLNLVTLNWNLTVPGLLLGFQGIDTTSGGEKFQNWVSV